MTAPHSLNPAALLEKGLSDVASWSQMRNSGCRDTEVAALFGVPPELVTLALDGWPTRRRISDERLIAALTAWRVGASRAVVAAELGMPREQLVRELRTGRSILSPNRLARNGLARRFRWDPAVVGRYCRSGQLPEPDGGTTAFGGGNPTSSAGSAKATRWCPTCRRAFLTHRGLKSHSTLVAPPNPMDLEARVARELRGSSYTVPEHCSRHVVPHLQVRLTPMCAIGPIGLHHSLWLPRSPPGTPRLCRSTSSSMHWWPPTKRCYPDGSTPTSAASTPPRPWKTSSRQSPTQSSASHWTLTPRLNLPNPAVTWSFHQSCGCGAASTMSGGR